MQHGLEQRVHIFKARTLHAGDEIRNQIHRAGTVERHKSDDFFQLGGVGLRQHLFHAGGFKLEHRRGVGLAEYLIGLLIREVDVVHIDTLASGLRNEFLRHFDDGEVAQAEEVKLHQPDVFHVSFVIHGNGRGGFVGLIHRAEIGNFARRNQYAAGVHTEAAREVFQLFGQLHQLFGLFLFQHLGDFRLSLHRLFQAQRLVGFQRNQLG